MCRADVTQDAEAPLAAILIDTAAALAEQAGVDSQDITIGPVDFGPCDG